MVRNCKRRADDPLVARAKDGDREAQALLLEKYKPMLWKLAIGRHFDNSFDVEDMVQHGAIALLRAIQQYVPGGRASFHTYARKCVSMQLLTFLRTTQLVRVPGHHKRDSDTFRRCANVLAFSVLFDDKTSFDADEYRELSVEPQHDLCLIEEDERRELTAMRRAIWGLSQRRRIAVILRLQGLTLREIGARMEVSKERARQLLESARKHLKVLTLIELRKGCTCGKDLCRYKRQAPPPQPPAG